MSFADISIRWKILILSAVLGACLVVVGGTGWLVTDQLLDEIDGLHKNELKQARFVNAARTYTRGIEGNMLEYFLAPNSANKANILKETEEYAGTLKKIWGELDKIEYDEAEQKIYKSAKAEIATATQYREATQL